MTHWLTLWRAAQLAGVSRAVLQKRIRSGELQENDGMVSSTELLRAYPQLELEDSGAFERVAQIREAAFARRVRERTLPSQEVLAQRLFAQSQELADAQRHLQRYHELLTELQARIDALAAAPTPPALCELGRFAEAGLARVLATENADVLTIMDQMLKVTSAHATVRPSGHEFPIEGRETLLQAGLRAGLRLNYGCGNGTCGLCKARVVSGAVAAVQPQDYLLSDAEKAQGYTLLCTHTAASGELTLETLEAAGPRDIPQQQIVTRARSVKALGEDTLELHLQTPRTNRLRFLAGQSVTLGIAAGGDDVQATYPVASCPCDDRNLHLFVARDPNDAFAQRLFAGAVKSGDPVSVWGPLGEFVLAEDQGELVFVGCDMGFAPLKSLIEHALAVDVAESLSLYWLATRRDGHFLANLCRAWDAALDEFACSLHTDVDAEDGAKQVASAIRADLLEPARCDFYVAGPQAFVQSVGGELQAAGVPALRIYSSVVG